MLFGLSMDYEVFLVSRMREEWDATHDNELAVARGLAKTGRIVTVAGLVMFAAFMGFVAGSIVGLQQFGFGLAAAILLDVTIVRALLVPSLMAIFGRCNWWLPERVARVVRVRPSPLARRELRTNSPPLRGRVASAHVWRLALIGAVGLAVGRPAGRRGVRGARRSLRHPGRCLAARRPGTLDRRLDFVQSLGVTTVRFGIHWDQVAPTRPARALASNDPAYRWSSADAILKGLRARRHRAARDAVRDGAWANGGRKPNVVPTSSTTFADFAYAAAKRYPFVRKWTVWNEPNQRLFLAHTSPSLYVTRLLNPAYAAIHRANRRALVAGGVDRAARKHRRLRAARLGARHGGGTRKARRLRAQPVRDPPARVAVPRRVPLLRRDLDVEPEPAARRRCAATSAASRSG